MPLVKNYSKDNNITDLDYLLGSNGDLGGRTQNYYIKDLKEVFGLNSNASIADIDGLQAALDGKVDDPQVLTDVPENAVFTDTVYILPFADNSVNWNAAFGWGDHSGLYSPLSHSHIIDDVTGLQAALDALDSNSTGLEELDQGDGIGWRLSARTATPYGPIGLGAVDFSYSTVSGNDFGALGRYSFTAPGFQLTATGYYSSVLGFNIEAYSFAETALGTYGTAYTPNSETAFDASDRIINIGIGSGDLSRADLFTGFKDGTLLAPSLTTALIDAAGDTSLIHKKYLADKGYLITITEENLGDLYDVSLGTPTTGDLIWYNGLAWNSKSLSEIGISEVGHTHSSYEDAIALNTAKVGVKKYNTVALMVSGSPAAGSIVTTLGYTAANDGGGNTFRIVDDATLTQDYGAIINITGNIYAVAVNTENLTNKHYGIFSDSSTNWPITAASRFNGMLDAAVLYSITIASPEGTYFDCQLNIDDSHSGAKIHFDNAVFSDLIHIVGTDINNKIENIVLTGHVTTYDRYGHTWTENVYGNLNITCKSDIAIHPTGSVGRGVHIYHTNTNVNIGSIVVEFAGASGSNVEAAFALDGETSGSTTSAPQGVNIQSVWVQDTDVRGAQITGTGHWIGTIQIDEFGSSTFDDSVPYIGSTSYTSETTSQIAQGVLIWNSDAKIDQIIVDQVNGFTGKSRALTDVAIGRALLENTPTVYKYTTPSIGSIISRNPQRQALSVGAYKNVSGLTLGSIQLPVIDDNNLLESNPSSERSNYGLVDVYYGSVDIGRVYVEDPKNAVMLMQRDVYASGTERQNAVVNVGVLHTPIVDVATTKYDIFQGSIDYVMAWNDSNNKGSYHTGTLDVGGLKMGGNLDVGGNIDFGANNNGYAQDDVNGSWIGNGVIRANEGVYYQRSIQAQRFYINSIEEARLTSTGLGIGKVATEKIDVDGNIRGDQFKLNALNTTPANASDTGELGEIRWDANYMYVCTATNTWKRAALATW